VQGRYPATPRGVSGRAHGQEGHNPATLKASLTRRGTLSPDIRNCAKASPSSREIALGDLAEVAYVSPIVVDWPRRWRDKHGECPSIKLRQLNRDPAYASYWENTIAFAEFSRGKHDWHLRPEEIPADAVLRLVSRKESDLPL